MWICGGRSLGRGECRTMWKFTFQASTSAGSLGLSGSAFSPSTAPPRLPACGDWPPICVLDPSSGVFCYLDPGTLTVTSVDVPMCVGLCWRGRAVPCGAQDLGLLMTPGVRLCGMKTGVTISKPTGISWKPALQTSVVKLLETETVDTGRHSRIGLLPKK